MNKDDLYIKQLMQELPKEKAPANITQLIMQKIEKKTQFVFTPVVPLWKRQNFYILIGVFLMEIFLLWSVKDLFTLENFVFVFKTIYIKIITYWETNNLNQILLILSCIGVAVYLFVKERINYSQQQFSAAYL